jgi:type IV pilus assembly protein PilO
MALAGIFVCVFVTAFALTAIPRLEDLDRAEDRVVRLTRDYLMRQRLALNLDAYRAQWPELRRMLRVLRDALPDRFDSDFTQVRQAAKRRGLRIELLQPYTETSHEFHALLRARLKVSGPFHAVGAFAGDLAALPGSVELYDIQVESTRAPGTVTLEGNVVVYRYRSDEEVAAQRRKAGTKK